MPADLQWKHAADAAQILFLFAGDAVRNRLHRQER